VKNRHQAFPPLDTCWREGLEPIGPATTEPESRFCKEELEHDLAVAVNPNPMTTCYLTAKMSWSIRSPSRIRRMSRNPALSRSSFTSAKV
jgi:hypothetical protein